MGSSDPSIGSAESCKSTLRLVAGAKQGPVEGRQFTCVCGAAAGTLTGALVGEDMVTVTRSGGGR